MNAKHRMVSVAARSFIIGALAPAAYAAAAERASITCPEESPLQNWTPSTFTPFPNFVQGDEAGVVLDAPANDYPLEILRIGIHWASQIGGAATQIEQAIHIYPTGLPNPGTAQFTLLGPMLADGVTNIFDISGVAGNKIINSGPFTVTLEFLNTQPAGNPFIPSVVADGDGCQLGKNALFVPPNGWLDACPQGVTGDWVFHVIYRRVDCDCNSNGIFDDDDIGAGTSQDCNSNAIPDECDISGGTSADCNATAIPDVCELDNNDCNTNGVPDECDPNFDGDGLIDDCDPDIDDDGVVNAADACDFTPPGANIVTDPQDPLYGTLRHDSDGDCDCDLVDFAMFQADFTSPGP